MKRLCAAVCAAVLSLSLAGCVPEEKSIDETAVENATNFKDIIELVNVDEKTRHYSECRNDKALLPYLELVRDNEYLIMEHKGKKYLLFRYYYNGSGYMLYVDKVRREESSDPTELRLITDIVDQVDKSKGCFGGGGSCGCIVELDSDFEKLTVNDEEYVPFDGVEIYVEERPVVLDKNLDLELPFKYKWLEKVEEPLGKDGKSRKTDLVIGGYDGGCSLMDKDYNVLLDTEYSGLCYINDNKFIAFSPKQTEGDNDEPINEMYIIDKEGNRLKGPVEGTRNGGGCVIPFNMEKRRDTFMRVENNRIVTGLIDSDLNIIIEPKYFTIAEYKLEESQRLFYAVENYDEKCAVFDENGVQQTDFKYKDPYTAYERYSEMMGEWYIDL